MSRFLITLAAQWAHLQYPSVPVDTLVHLAWTESRFTLTARNGSHLGVWQVSWKYSKYPKYLLYNPFIGATEAARLLSWADARWPGRSWDWYKGRLDDRRRYSYD